jgi:cyclophilin family peptidyl-prolyl cis-trans isomerase
MKKRFVCLIIAAVMLLTACGSGSGDEAARGNITELTDPAPGDIYAEIKFLDYEQEVIFKLFPELAPIGVEEFAVRAERGFYNNRNIHRVIQNSLIQGGSVNFDGTEGEVEFGELYPVESSPYARHFYGALSLVADEAMFNYCQFYVVVNKIPVDIDAEIEVIETFLENGQLNEYAQARLRINLNVMKAIPENVKQQYLTRGGTPHLDGTATVIGQLVSGSEVIDAIAASVVAYGNAIDDADGTPSKPVEEIIIEYIKIIRIPSDEEEPEEEAAPRRRETPQTNPQDELTIPVDLDDPILPSDDEESEETE